MRGGGVKGLAFCGALQELEDVVTFTAYVGTSAGAITALLLGAGYNPTELTELVANLDFRRFMDASRWRAAMNFIGSRYLYPGDAVEKWIEEVLRAKLPKADEILLGDLQSRVVLYAVEPRFGSCVFDSKTNPKQPAVPAARFSMSIPFFFRAHEHNSRPIYDGGIVRNFPIVAAIRELGVADEDILGLYLGDLKPKEYEHRGILIDLLSIWLQQDEPQIVQRLHRRVIAIDPSPVGTLQFDLSVDDKEMLILAGRVAAAEYIGAHGYPFTRGTALDLYPFTRGTALDLVMTDTPGGSTFRSERDRLHA